MTLRHLIDFALAAVFAPPCAACGHVLTQPLRSAVCDTCWNAIAPFTGPTCATCGVPLPAWRTTSHRLGRCARCRRRPPVLTRQASIGPYDGALRDVLHALKYGRRPSVVPDLCSRLREAGSAVLDGVDACVPVPLHWRRRWTRGFNQAKWLARGLGPPVVSLLRRARHTPPQVGLPAAGRRRNVQGAFAWNETGGRRLGAAAGRLPPGTILVLVDDVATTGATLDACARVLRAHGAADVRALTAARAVHARPD